MIHAQINKVNLKEVIFKNTPNKIKILKFVAFYNKRKRFSEDG